MIAPTTSPVAGSPPIAIACPLVVAVAPGCAGALFQLGRYRVVVRPEALSAPTVTLTAPEPRSAFNVAEFGQPR